MPYEGREPYVDPGTEPVDHTGEDDEATEVEETSDESEVEETDEGSEETEEAAETPAVDPELAQKAAFYDYVQTKDGAVEFLIEAGLGIGKSLDELESFFSDKPAEPAEPESTEDDDRVMTVAEWKAEAARLRGEITAEQQERDNAALAQAVNETATAALHELRIGDEPLTPKQLQIVAAFADTELDPNVIPTPAQVHAAIEAGFKEFTEGMGFSAEGKKVVNPKKQVPKGLKGSTGGSAETVEPQNLEEAFARARARLKEQGEI